MKESLYEFEKTRCENLAKFSRYGFGNKEDEKFFPGRREQFILKETIECRNK